MMHASLLAMAYFLTAFAVCACALSGVVLLFCDIADALRENTRDTHERD